MKTLRRNKRESTKSPFDIAYETRKLELELFWKRYSVFWTVTGAVFVAYGFSKDSLQGLSFVIACFGIITSYAWYLINRGNKYWQETWERRVHAHEAYVMFNKWETIQDKGIWRAKRYSVSKIAIMLSFFVFLLWIFIAVYDFLTLVGCNSACTNTFEIIVACLAIVFMITGLIFLSKKGKSTLRVEDGKYSLEPSDHGKWKLEKLKDKELAEDEIESKITNIKSKNEKKIAAKLWKLLPEDVK